MPATAMLQSFCGMAVVVQQQNICEHLYVK